MTFIYFIERHPTYRPILRPVFELLDRQSLFALSSYITLIEVLVQPIRKGRLDLAQQYRNVLVQAGNFTLFPIDQAIAEESAKIRAEHGFPTPDAIQLATALQQEAEVFVTNDNKLKRFNQLDVLVLDDFLPSGSA
jgi:predicted nucleic acid-binding protein